MRIIDERSLKLTPEEYFNYCKKKSIRGLWVITDKQSIFYSQVIKDDNNTHDNIQINIENEIHPHNQINGWNAIRSNHAYIASIGEELIITMPDNGQLSYSQAKFIIDILNIVEKFNSNNENIRQIKIDLFEPPRKESVFNKSTKEEIEILKNKIQSEITPNIIIDKEQEEIIGTTLSKEEIKENIISNLNINSYQTLDALSLFFYNCSLYYQDDYYQDIFKEIMPNYNKIIKLYNNLTKLYQDSIPINKITLDNLEDKLKDLIQNIFKDNKSFTQIINNLQKINHIDQQIADELFPHHELLLNICHQIMYFDKDKLDKLLKSAISYEDIFKAIITFSKPILEEKVEKNEDEQKKNQKELARINIIANIIHSKDYLNELINERKKKIEENDEYNNKIIENINNLTTEKNKQDKLHQLIKEKSSNLIKKIINRKQIKQYRQELQTSINKSNNLEHEKQILKSKLDIMENITNEIRNIEREFKDITKLDYIPSDISFIDNYNQTNINEFKEIILKCITYINDEQKQISKIIKEIDTFQESCCNTIYPDQTKKSVR